MALIIQIMGNSNFRIRILAAGLMTCWGLLIVLPGANAQTVIEKDSVNLPGTTVVYPGKHYSKSGFHNLIFGKHYRREWATAIRVNNFYIDTAYGGLQVLRESGSRQTKGLRLQSKAGKQYVLRSVDKDFGQGLAPIYQGTFISNAAKDQATIGYPGAAVTITPMITAAGIYHTNPVLVFLPKQVALDEFNDTHGDQLYLFEERADDDQHDAPWFGNSKNVIGSTKLFEYIYSDNDHQVDQLSFGKARLFDMMIGDWGRHTDQWRWASFKTDGKVLYKPIPRDRDQVYTTFDGLLPWIATNIAGGTHLESFSHRIKNIGDFNMPGHHLDIHFANQLTKDQWIDAAKLLQQAVTDSVIEQGMLQLPAPLYKQHSRVTITSHLKSRRDRLPDFAGGYYNYLAKKIAVYGSDEEEVFEINRISDNETGIQVFKIDKNGIIASTPFYSRNIFTNETKEVWLYGFKGKDIFKIKGQPSAGVKIRVIGFTNKDSLMNMAGAADRNTTLHRGNSDLYDTVFQKKIKISPIIIVTPSVYKLLEDDILALFTNPGLHLGLNFIYRPQVWKRDIDEPTHNLSVNYGILRKTFYVNYLGIYPHAVGKFDLLLKAKYDIVAAENFFGVGNETKDSSGIGAPNRYYNVFSRRLYGGIGLNLKIKDVHQFNTSVFYQNIKINLDSGNYISDKLNTMPVFEANQYAGIAAGYIYRNVNNQLLPTKGVNYEISAGYIRSVDKKNIAFFKGMSAFSFYVPMGRLLSFASRVGGATNIGEAPYYYLNELGGNENLRGYARERFYGKTSFYNNNELRLIGNTRNIFFNGKAGVFGFFDNGRVWQPGEHSTKWHMGYGAGALIAPFNKFILMAAYGLSADGNQLLLKARMLF